jgi:hypothetical protein
MTWTASKAKASFNGSYIRQEVTFTDDAKSAPGFVIGYEVNKKNYVAPWPDTLIFAELAELNAVVDLTTIPIGPPLSPIVPEPPTQDQLNAIAYQQNLAQLFQAKQVADVLAWAATSTDPTVQAIADQVNTLAASAPALKVVETATKVTG